ncbi:MAG: hypothetical protein ACI4FX_09420 [Agathobacter sp.]
MKKTKKIIQITYMLLLLLVAALSAGCSGEEAEDDTLYFYHSLSEGRTQMTEQSSQTEAEPIEEMGVFLITGMSSKKEYLMLYSYATGLEYRYYYGMDTKFYDKYGGRTTAASFEPGLAVTIGEVTPEGVLSSVQASDAVWEYEDVSRFSIDPQLGMLKIADRKFRYDDRVYVFSKRKRASMEDIEQGDVLSVIGVDKQILSVRITTAQGTLKLTHTGLFEGSFLQLGDKIFTEITPELSLKVPEGKYTLTVANNGWGGSKDVKIKRGEITTVDLNELKGSGPKYGKIRFLIDEEDAVLMIDGEEKPVGAVLSLTYGKHSVAVYTSEYDVWRRNLYVNSEEATLVVSLGEEEQKEETSSEAKEDDTGKNTSSETQKDTQNEEDSESQKKETETKSEYEKRKEELETIKDLISGMTESSAIVSN